jgi:hypothetical protein
MNDYSPALQTKMFRLSLLDKNSLAAFLTDERSPSSMVIASIPPLSPPLLSIILWTAAVLFSALRVVMKVLAPVR